MRLPWTIWRYTTVEVWRLVLLTTTVCVLVVSFAATVKPLADGKLDAGDVVRYMFLAIPPMLQYVLPFAAGFGTTLAFHRMASENELEAARTGGISFGSLLVPAWASGLVLAGALGLLGDEVVPRFWRAMQGIVAEDVTRLITNSINRGESVKIGDALIHADRVDRLGPDEASGAYDRLVLSRVVVLVIDRQGNVEAESTAGRAWAWFQRGDAGETVATVRLETWSGTGADGARGSLASGVFTRSFPNTFRDDVKFLTGTELRRLPANPDRMNVIDLRRRDLAFHIAREDSMRSIQAELAAQRRARLSDDGGRSYAVLGSGLVRREEDDKDLKWFVTPPASGAEIEVEVMDPGSPTETHQRYAAKAAYLTSSIGIDALERDLRLTLHLEGVRPLVAEITDPGEQIQSTRDYTRLRPRVNPLDELLSMNSRTLLAESRRRLARTPDESIARPTRELARRIDQLGRDVRSRQHERFAMSVSCLIMVLTGSVTAIRMRNRLPVPVYLWSFFPGIASVLAVNAGKEIARTVAEPGLAVMWGGLAALGLYAAVVYAAIRRH